MIPSDSKLEEAYIPIKQKKKWGLVDKNCNLVLGFEYDSLFLGFGYCFAEKNGKHGVMDAKGNILIDFIYDDIWYSEFLNGYFTAELNCKHGIIDKDNNIIVDFKYSNFQYAGSEFNQEYVVAYLGDKCGIIDLNGNVVIDFIYDYYMGHKNGYFKAQLNALWGVVDKNNKVIIPFEYKSLWFWEDDSFCVETQSGKWILINSNNQKICMKEYDYINSPLIMCKSKLFLAMIDSKWGFINKYGNIVIDLKYEEAGDFYQGLATVCLNDKWGLIDENENLIIPFEYDEKWFVLKEDSVIAQKDGKYGVIDYYNNIIVDFLYESEDDLPFYSVAKGKV